MATKKLNLTIQLKRGTTEEWEQFGYIVPAVGEPCLDLTTGHLRFGDGETAYKDLPDATAVYDGKIFTLQETDLTFQRNIEYLFELVGDENSGLTSELSSLRFYVGQIPEESQASNVIGYIAEAQASLSENLQTYVDMSQAEEHSNKEILDEITRADINQWSDAQPNVIEAIRVNGVEVPVSRKTAEITVSTDGGSSPLPEVTAADNGKFLRVVNGVWVADKLTDVSEEGM